MRIARVFPTRTSMTPIDDDAYYGNPELFMPEYDEIHISTVFTWDKKKAEELAYQWEQYGKVKIGGPAYKDKGSSFTPGLYLKEGITITSRGCSCNCDFCVVPYNEGKIRELEIKEGYIVQDNNLLACSPLHLDKVFKMLKEQGRNIFFRGGLQASRITDKIIERLRGIKLGRLWLAYDYPVSENPIKRAVKKLRKYFTRDQIYCFVLVGFGDDSIEKAESRLRRVIDLGMFPFAMSYKDNNGEYKNTSPEWKELIRNYSRPAIISSIIKEMGIVR